MRNFELFKGDEMPMLSLRRCGQIGLNEAAYVLLGSPERVVLLINRSAGRIALQPATAKERRGYVVRRSGMSYKVNGKAFFGHYGIATGHAFTPELQDGNLVIELAKGKPRKAQEKK